jgi:U3 small nucleolar RNA-associated protein 25
MYFRYSSGPEISAARSSFFNKHLDFLLVTERYHFFKRHALRGIRSLFFYQLPLYPASFCFYVSFLPNDECPFCLIDRYDADRIIGIFGLQKAVNILASSKYLLFVKTGA